MSHNDWEAGTIKLPTTEFARVRKAMQDGDAKRKEAVFGQTQEIWKGLTRKQQTDPAEYRRAVSDTVDEKMRAAEAPMRFGARFRVPTEIPEDTEAILEDAREAMQRMVWQRDSKPRRVTKSDMDFPTNRSTSFHAEDCNVNFDRENSTVSWAVHDNNHAVERARGTHVAEALFVALSDVKWTRGTGGTITGNDEYNGDSREHGGGANYYTDAFGPVGAEDAPGKCRPYTDSKGKRVTAADLSRIRQEQFQREMNLQRKMMGGGGGSQGRVTKGVKEGGQFAQSRRGETGVRLR